VAWWQPQQLSNAHSNLHTVFLFAVRAAMDCHGLPLCC
jgi:hypothetical protein